MKTLNLREIKPEWLARRRFVCYLPTEMVIPCRYTNSFEPPPLDCVYAYSLPDKEFVPIKREEVVGGNVRAQWWDRYCLLEIHEDYGSDGHTEYTFMNKYVIVLESETPKNFKEYDELKRKLWEQERLERDALPKQPELTEQPRTRNWYVHW